MPYLRKRPRFAVGWLLLIAGFCALCAGCGHTQGETTESNRWGRNQSSSLSEERLDAVIDDRILPVAADSTTPSPVPTAEEPTDLPAYFDRSKDRPTAELYPTVWGLAGLRGYLYGEQVAPNGVEFTPIFSGEWHFNLWLWRAQHLYAFTDSVFWAQKAGLGVTNPSQGAFDFSKREFDLSAGFAWNYSGRWEARAFAYSFNNLNRGESKTTPRGFTDGVGVENRYYIGSTYDALGTAEFDLARATFVSMGYYPTKDMVDFKNHYFFPSLFARAYLTYDLAQERCYLYADTTFVTRKPLSPKMLEVDAGVAYRPFLGSKGWEFRLGADERIDLEGREVISKIYWSARIIY